MSPQKQIEIRAREIYEVSGEHVPWDELSLEEKEVFLEKAVNELIEVWR